MKIGFTGTRDAMTISQWAKVQDLMSEEFEDGLPNEWHDGDAIGADAQAHGCADLLKEHFDIETHGHPCNLSDQRAYKDFDVDYPVEAPLVRNRIIVDTVDVMIAAPKEYLPVARGSGTWATIRYATGKKKLHIVWPNGSYETYDAEGTLFDE
jgi:hypothetical protein